MYIFDKERALRGDKVINEFGREIKGLKANDDLSNNNVFGLKDEQGTLYTDQGYYFSDKAYSEFNLYMAYPDIECNAEEAEKDQTISFNHGNLKDIIDKQNATLKNSLTPKIEIVEIPQDDSEVFYIDVWNDEGQMALSWTNERQLEEPGYKKVGMLKLTLNRKDFIKD